MVRDVLSDDTEKRCFTQKSPSPTGRSGEQPGTIGPTLAGFEWCTPRSEGTLRGNPSNICPTGISLRKALNQNERGDLPAIISNIVAELGASRGGAVSRQSLVTRTWGLISERDHGGGAS